MKAAVVLVGFVIFALGVYIATGQAHYNTNKEVLNVGGLKASVQEPHTVPAWSGAIAIVAGAALVFVGLRR